jgi:hypothetical protein
MRYAGIFLQASSIYPFRTLPRPERENYELGDFGMTGKIVRSLVPAFPMGLQVCSLPDQ